MLLANGISPDYGSDYMLNLPFLFPTTLVQVLTQKSFHNRAHLGGHPNMFEAPENDPSPDNETYRAVLIESFCTLTFLIGWNSMEMLSSH